MGGRRRALPATACLAAALALAARGAAAADRVAEVAAALAESERLLYAARYGEALARLELAPTADGETLPAAARVALAAQRAEVRLVASALWRRADEPATTLLALQELAPEAEALAELPVRASFLSALAAAELHAGELAAAAEHAAAAAELRELMGDARGRAESAALVGRIEWRAHLLAGGGRAGLGALLGRLEAAGRAAEAAEAIRVEADLLRLQGHLLLTLFEDPLAALSRFTRAAELGERIRFRPGLAAAYAGIADARAELGEPETALLWYRLAFATADESGDLLHRVRPRLRLAAILRARGETDAARGWLDEARRIAELGGWPEAEREAGGRFARAE